MKWATGIFVGVDDIINYSCFVKCPDLFTVQ